MEKFPASKLIFSINSCLSLEFIAAVCYLWPGCGQLPTTTHYCPWDTSIYRGAIPPTTIPLIKRQIQFAVNKQTTTSQFTLVSNERICSGDRLHFWGRLSSPWQSPSSAPELCKQVAGHPGELQRGAESLLGASFYYSNKFPQETSGQGLSATEPGNPDDGKSMARGTISTGN